MTNKTTTPDHIETVLDYRARLVRMQAGDAELSLEASIGKAKAWIADEKWLPTPDLKNILRRLVEAVEASPRSPAVTAPERAP